MKLHLNFVPAIIAVLFLMLMVGVREEVRDEFIAEQGIPSYTIPSLAAPSTPAGSLGIPGIFGYGAPTLTTCNRDTVFVHHVTSNSTGDNDFGTLDSLLQSAMHDDTLDVIVFDVGGWQRTVYQSSVSGPLNCVYIAGQTAPGGGAGMRNEVTSTVLIFSLGNDDRDVVIRGLTIANRGRADGAGGSTAPVSVTDGQRIIFAENTFLWADEKHLILGTTGTNDTVTDITINRNLFAQAQIKEPTSMQVTESGNKPELAARMTFARNLWHSNAWRNPLIGNQNDPPDEATDSVARARLIGNVWYNTGFQGVLQIRSRMVDILDSYVKSGLQTNDGVPSGADYSWAVAVDLTHSGDSTHSIYVERLIGPHNRDTLYGADSLWGGSNKEVACYYVLNCTAGEDPRDVVGSQIKRDTALTAPTFAFARINPFTLKDEILGTGTGVNQGQVGAYRFIQSDGTFGLRADSMLAALLKEARDSTGISSPFQIDSTYVTARYNYPKAVGTACTDSDSNDLCDDFENANWGSLGQSVSGDSDADGWTNIEEYLNGTNPRIFTVSDASESTPTYFNGTDSVYVRRISMKDSVPHFEGDTIKVPSDAAEIPDATAVTYPDTATTTVRGLHFTCKNTAEGIVIIDSLTFADSADIITGITSTELMTRQPPGCT